MIEDLLDDLNQGMTSTVENLVRALAKRRTGRANIALLNDIKVEYYGSLSPLNQIASVQVPDPRLITIKPWDKALVPAIEKTLQVSGLGFNPSSDGESVRLPIPPLTGERRAELVKEIKKIGEDAKVALRNQRRDTNEMAKSLEKEKTISEDDLRRGLVSIQEVTDRYAKEVDNLVTAKEKEVLED